MQIIQCQIPPRSRPERPVNREKRLWDLFKGAVCQGAIGYRVLLGGEASWVWKPSAWLMQYVGVHEERRGPSLNTEEREQGVPYPVGILSVQLE